MNHKESVLYDVAYEWVDDPKYGRIRRHELAIKKLYDLVQSLDERVVLGACKVALDAIEEKPKSRTDITTDGEKLHTVVMLPSNGNRGEAGNED